MKLFVKKQGGDYSTIQEAIDAVPHDEESEIIIGEGYFREKIFCEKKNISFKGEGIDKTVIDFYDHANEILSDGSKRGTFRSYTAFFGGGYVTVRDMTIKNSAGDGSVVGQAVAVYADADRCFFERVKMTACQDTLFCAPLPRATRQPKGFMGPRAYTERRLTKQYYKDCQISGDVDFIFGGADAVFDNCVITCNKRNKPGEERAINGYVTATCGRKEDLGFVFRSCTVKGDLDCEKGSVFLGRPWREEAKTVFINCIMDDTIAPERFSGWEGVDRDEPDTFYGEFGTRTADGQSITGFPAKNSWVRDIDEDLADEISMRADEVVRLTSPSNLRSIT